MERTIILTVYRQNEEPFTKEITLQQFYSVYDIIRSTELMFDEYSDIEISIPGKPRDVQPQTTDESLWTEDETGEQEEEAEDKTGYQGQSPQE